MKLIDKTKIEYLCMRQPCGRFNECNECQNNMTSIVDIEGVPVIDAIPRYYIDAAINELKERYPKNVYGEPELNGNCCVFSLNDVLEILKEI